jgi:hypothetical protein
MSLPLLESVQLECNQHLVTYPFQLSNSNLNLRNARLWHK